jgi:hypothetical protein
MSRYDAVPQYALPVPPSNENSARTVTGVGTAAVPDMAAPTGRTNGFAARIRVFTTLTGIPVAVSGKLPMMSQIASFVPVSASICHRAVPSAAATPMGSHARPRSVHWASG